MFHDICHHRKGELCILSREEFVEEFQNLRKSYLLVFYVLPQQKKMLALDRWSLDTFTKGGRSLQDCSCNSFSKKTISELPQNVVIAIPAFILSTMRARAME
jgi:hypothetical protein